MDGSSGRRAWRRRSVWAIAALLAGVGWFSWPRPFRLDPPPNPNGYDDLVAAAEKVEGDLERGTISDETDDELRAFVGPNREALHEARAGLNRESLVTLPMPPKRAFTARLLDRIQSLRKLARLFAADAALAAREGRPADAARGYADMIRLGRAITPGGLFTDRLVGRAVEGLGAEGLARQVASLSADDARRLAAEVERLEAGHEPITRMFHRDAAYARAQWDWPTRIALTVQGAVLRRLKQTSEAAATQADRRAEALLRSLAATLALRAHRLDHPDGPPPTALDALVPAYLKAVPADPFGTGPLRLKVSGDAVTVYSVGPDGRDDGGVPAGKPTSGRNPPPGDLVLPR